MATFCECPDRDGVDVRVDGKTPDGREIRTPVCPACRRPIFKLIGDY